MADAGSDPASAYVPEVSDASDPPRQALQVPLITRQPPTPTDDTRSHDIDREFAQATPDRGRARTPSLPGGQTPIVVEDGDVTPKVRNKSSRSTSPVRLLQPFTPTANEAVNPVDSGNDATPVAKSTIAPENAPETLSQIKKQTPSAVTPASANTSVSAPPTASTDSLAGERPSSSALLTDNESDGGYASGGMGPPAAASGVSIVGGDRAAHPSTSATSISGVANPHVPPGGRLSVFSRRSASKGASDNEGRRTMTLETETVSNIAHISAAKLDPSARSIRSKASTDTVRAGAGVSKPRKKRSQMPVRDAASGASRNQHAPTKSEVYAASITRAVDENDESDSDETYVYESNPRSPKRISRSPSLSSMASREGPPYHTSSHSSGGGTHSTTNHTNSGGGGSRRVSGSVASQYDSHYGMNHAQRRSISARYDGSRSSYDFDRERCAEKGYRAAGGAGHHVGAGGQAISGKRSMKFAHGVYDDAVSSNTDSHDSRSARYATHPHARIRASAEEASPYRSPRSLLPGRSSNTASGANLQTGRSSPVSGYNTPRFAGSNHNSRPGSPRLQLHGRSSLPNFGPNGASGNGNAPNSGSAAKGGPRAWQVYERADEDEDEEQEEDIGGFRPNGTSKHERSPLLRRKSDRRYYTGTPRRVYSGAAVAHPGSEFGRNEYRSMTPSTGDRYSSRRHSWSGVPFIMTIVCLMMVVLMAGAAVLSTTQPLRDLSVANITNVLVSTQELSFDLVLQAYNPNALQVQIAHCELSLFAQSPFVAKPSTPKPTSTAVPEEDEGDNGGSGGWWPWPSPPHKRNATLPSTPSPPPQEKSSTLLLGRVRHFDAPLTFDSRFFNRSLAQATGELRLESPGGDDEEDGGGGGKGAWERVIAHPFSLIVRGVVLYGSTNPFSLIPGTTNGDGAVTAGMRSAEIYAKINVDPAAAAALRLTY
ncbi:Vacuolar inheritance and morphology protein [Savitreella phatthalungensis]